MKQEHLKLYDVDMKYVRNLSKVDDKVRSVSPQINKDTRPFIGIIVICDEKKYCVPLSSPKDKHQKMNNDRDFTKIYNKHNRLIGVLDFNLMIPVDEKVISVININSSKKDTPELKARKNLMKDQLLWCRQNQDSLINKANKLYRIVTETPDKMRNLTRRCCDFKKLEAVLEKYISKGERAAEKSSVRQSPYSRKKMNEMSQKVAQEKSNRNEHSKDISHKKSDQSL